MNSQINMGGYRDVTLYPTNHLIYPLLSTIATAIVLIVSICTKFYKKMTNIMVFAVIFSNFIFSAAMTSSAFFRPTGQLHCKILEAASIFGIVSSLLWGTFFGHVLLQATSAYRARIQPNLIRIYIALSIVIPLALSIASGYTSLIDFASDDKSCYHRIYHSSPDYMYLAFYGLPLTILMLLNVIIYTKIILRLRSVLQTGTRRYLFVLMTYPGIILITWTPMLVVNILLEIGVNAPQVLYPIFHILCQLQGFFQSLIYVKETRNFAAKFCRAIICCWRKKAEISPVNSPAMSDFENMRLNSKLLMAGSGYNNNSPSSTNVQSASSPVTKLL